MSNYIIFICPNIFDHVSGVSTKYISFLKYLGVRNICPITLCNVSKKKVEINNVNYMDVFSVPLPLYNLIHIPLFNTSVLDKHIKEINEKKDIKKIVVIFHSEFIWLHNGLLNIKKKYKNIMLIPNMHTDIDYYVKNYLGNIVKYVPFELSNFVDNNLKNNMFDKILVTGAVLEKKYKNIVGKRRVLNVNEIDITMFEPYYKSVLYRRDYINNNGASINVIYCGRISIEKNITMNFEICDYLLKFYLQNDISKINVHIIGGGPYENELKKYVEMKYGEINKKTKFYGVQKQEWVGNFYKNIYNPIFLFCSESETFGKTSVEAMITGIPVFQKRSPIANELFEDCKNAFLFDNQSEFLKKFNIYMKMNNESLISLDHEMDMFVQKYEQKKIFKEWSQFILE